MHAAWGLEQYSSEGAACLQAVSLVDRILRERADDIIDMDKAVRRVEAERHHQLPASAHEVPSQIRSSFHRKHCVLGQVPMQCLGCQDAGHAVAFCQRCSSLIAGPSMMKLRAER